MFRSIPSRDLFAELDRLHKESQQAFDLSPSIRGLSRGRFPAINVGSTASSIEVRAFLPGFTPADIEVHVERGVLIIAGERKSDLPAKDAKASVHINERFVGPFRRVVSLPDDADTEAIEAKYRDGVLHVNIKRRVATEPRRIDIN